MPSGSVTQEELTSQTPSHVFNYDEASLLSVIRHAPLPFHRDTMLTKTDMIKLVLDFQAQLQISVRQPEVKSENKRAMKKLLRMTSLETIKMGEHDEQQLIQLIEKSFLYEGTLQPCRLDGLRGLAAAEIAIDWKVHASQDVSPEKPVQVKDETPPVSVINRLLGPNMSTTPSAFGLLDESEAAHLPTKTKTSTAIIGGFEIAASGATDADFTAKILPSQISPYPGRTLVKPRLKLKVFEGPSIINSLFNEGINLDLMVRGRYWKNTSRGEGLHAESEAVTWALVIQLALLDYSTEREALKKHSWIEVALRRLSALLHVEELVQRGQSTRSTAWRITSHILECVPTSSICVSSIDTAIKRHLVAFPGDLRILGPGISVGGVNVEESKTSPLQFEPLKDTAVLELLGKFSKKPGTKGKLFNLTYARLLADIKSTGAEFRFINTAFCRHSSRIGGALQDYLAGTPVESIAITGRWKAIESLRYYLRNGRAWLMKLNCSPSMQSTLRSSARKMESEISHSI